jgi:formate-dependent nitrite reductase cytochrome c552 subunit
MRNRVALIAVAGAVVLVGIAVFVHSRRPAGEVQRPSAEDVKGTGKCVECHRLQTAGIVRQWQDSRHAQVGVSCLDCHKPRDAAHQLEHKGFQITRNITAGTCAECHRREYSEFLRSRHAASSWTAVRGNADLSEAQLAEARRWHPEAIDRPANPLPELEGPGALQAGCKACHEVGAPNYDQSIGNCTKCHGRHTSSVAMARTSDTCGSCHMGPDHSQIEIWRESRHGVMFVARRSEQQLDARGQLTPNQQDTPTCSTCHFSGMGGVGSSHDVGERLSYYLFAAVSEKRPNFDAARAKMKAVCLNCHSSGHVDRFYEQADVTLANTNAQVKKSQEIMSALYKDGILTKTPFDEPIEFLAFDLWHYYGRTAKHGAYMGGADFSQWHGNYELQVKLAELRAAADELRGKKK